MFDELIKEAFQELTEASMSMVQSKTVRKLTAAGWSFDELDDNKYAYLDKGNKRVYVDSEGLTYIMKEDHHLDVSKVVETFEDLSVLDILAEEENPQ